MQPKVSIIIPVYNTEKFLRQCMDSVVNQTLDNIQVILINDGSKDNSASICQEYANQYEFVEYYNQENKGSAAARNIGLDYATGEYVGFIDSDDWIELDMYEHLYQTAKENGDVDIVFCRVFEDECPGSYEYIMPREGLYTDKELREEIYPYMMPHVTGKGNFRSIRWCNWLRIYKKSIIDEYHIRSCEGVSNCEDLGFNTECNLHAKSYYYLSECLYHNRPNPSSQSRNYVEHMWPRTKKLINDMERFVSVCPEDKVQKNFKYCVFYFVTMNIRNEMRIKDNSKEKNIQLMVDDSICKNAVRNIDCKGMNSEYAGIYSAVKTDDARKVIKYMNMLNFKKQKLFPFLASVISLPAINVIYKKIRRR